MLPADLFNKNISPPFVILPGDNVILPAEMAHGALTPQKRATTEQHSNVPVAKRLQLIHEACNDLSSGTPVSLDNNNIFNYSVNNNTETIENSGDPNNIAGTPAFITTLMKFIKFSDEQRQSSIDTKMAQQQHPSTTTPTAMSPKDASACANQAIWSADSFEGYKTSAPTTTNSKLPSISNACENSMMITSHNSLPSMNQIIPNKPQDGCASDTEDCVFDDDDCLLNNLPTSVDDLQDMEKQIKMERHFSSPLMSHRHTPSNYDPGRLSAASGASFIFDGALSAASNHPEEEELDADDLEVAMINESFEEQQRQYKLYCGDKLKSAFYSAPEESFYDCSTVEHEPPVVYPITVPENEEPLYTNDSLYCQWKEESPQLSSAYDTIAKPIVNDIFNNIIPALDDDEDDEDSITKSNLASLHPSIPESMDSLKLYKTSARNDISPPQSSFNSGGEDSFVDPEEDAIATVLSSAKFVLEELESPEMLDCESPLLMKSPKNIFGKSPPLVCDIKSNSDESEDEAELVSAWEEIKHSGTTGDNVRYYFPRNHATPLPPPLLDKIEMVEEPPKNIKSLAHVTEIYDHNGEIDTEPALQYFQSIGMKNFYQREIDIQRAFLVFPTVNDAKFAVENNKTGLQLRLLEESPQFVKLKALKMYSELRPCSIYDSPSEPHLTEMCMPWQSLSEPIAGV